MIAPVLLVALALQTSSAAPYSNLSATPSSATAAGSGNASAQPNADGLYKVGKDVLPPSLIHQVEPAFSKEARKRKITATSIVTLIVDANGTPQNVHILQSAAEGVKNQKDKAAAITLDAKAVEAVQQYRFRPATKDGRPVPVEVRVEVNFQIF